MKLNTLIRAAVLTVAGVSQLMALQVKMQTFSAGAGGNYRADPSADLEWVLSNYALGKSTDGTWFGTFCIETDEYFSPGSTYNVVLNDKALQGGSNTNSGDYLSQGTAYLYSRFAQGTLSGFTYGSSASALALQNAIWWLEDEISLGSNVFKDMVVSYFGSVSAAKVQYTGSSVKVMNLTSNQGRTLNQDQLVYVPDGGWTAMLLGLGLLSLALIKCQTRRA